MTDSESNSDSDSDLERKKNDDEVDWKNMENIRVICRFRPPNSREKREEKQNNLVNIPINITNNGSSIKLSRPDQPSLKPYEFNLDKILPQNTSQQQVFLQVSKPMVEACLEGFNTTIFAYGQVY